MAGFDKKKWLDAHVASIHPNTQMYSFFWNGDPPSEVLVYLKLKQADRTWPEVVKDLIDQGFRFDVIRELAKVPKEEGGYHLIFGGDGTPMFSKDGVVTVRLYRKVPGDDGDPRDVGLILELGHHYEKGLEAAEAIKKLFESFDCSPLEVPEKYGTPFGAA